MTPEQFFKIIHAYEQENARWRVLVAIQACIGIYLSIKNLKLLSEKEKNKKEGA